MRECARRRARQERAVLVDVEIHEAVVRLDRRGRERTLDPWLGDELALFPSATVQREITEARHVPGVDEHAAAPVPPAGHRLHGQSVEHYPGVLISEPS